MYLPFSMTDQQDLPLGQPPGQRYLKSTSHGTELSEAGIEAERTER